MALAAARPRPNLLLNQTVAMLAHRAHEQFILLGIFLATLALLPQSAHAEEAEKSILVLRVSQGGKFHERLTSSVQEYLRRSALPMAATGTLGSQERKCNEPSCLSDLAKHLDTPLLIVTASIIVQQNDRFLEASLFDTDSGRNRTAEDVCDGREVERRLKNMIRQLVDDSKANTPSVPLAHPRATAPEPTATAPEPSLKIAAVPEVPLPKPLAPALLALPESPGALKSPPRRRLPLPGWRRGLAGVLGTVAVLSLGGAISLQALSVTGYEGDSCRQFLEPGNSCIGNFTGLYAGGYAVAGAALLGTILTLKLPVRR